MYNALAGLGGSGQLDSTVAANANVALLAATAGTALTLVPPIFDVRNYDRLLVLSPLLKPSDRCLALEHAY